MNEIEQAIKAIENIAEYWTCRLSERQAAQLALAALREQAEREREIERLREAQRWTDTEYDTPDIGQAVLLYMPDKETDNIRAGEYMGEGDYRIGNKLYRGMEIDAWLPLSNRLA